MKRIVLICAGGLSTSLMVNKMKNTAQKEGMDVEIVAMSMTALDRYKNKFDVLLLGPHINYMESEMRKKYEPKGIKVAMISMEDYGRMDGESVLHFTCELIKEKKEKKMKDKITDFFGKLDPILTKVGSSPYLQAISGAMMGTLGVVLIGSVAVLILVLPGNYPFLSFLGAFGGLCSKLYTLTIGGMALYVSALSAYRLVKLLNAQEDAIPAAIISLVSFLVITPLGATAEGASAIPTTWLSSQGVFSALIIGLLTGKLYTFIKEKKLVIKMPESVPPMVTSVFESLIPCVLIIIFFGLVNWAFELTSFGNMHQFIYSMIQAPLQGLGSSIVAVVLVSLLIQLLWFFGLHGQNIVMPIVQALWMAMDVENLNALAAGLPLPNIVGYAWFTIITWGGTSLGLVLLMLRAKSKQYREVGKVALGPILFGIGEPVVFGVPLVFNFKLAVPLITNNAILLALSYFLTKIGVMARCAGVSTIFGLPLGLYAAIEGSASIVIFHLVSQLVIGPLLWYPWFKRLDNETYAIECQSETE